jgi:hypothetical protein
MSQSLVTSPAILAATTGAAYCDRSTWGRILVGGCDRLTFLHNQTSNNFKVLQPGQGCETVVLNSTARTLDLVTAWVGEEAVGLLVSPERREFLMEWFDRYIFFNDQVTLTDVSESTGSLSLMGPNTVELLGQLGLATPPATLHHHCEANFKGQTVQLIQGSGLMGPGVTIWGDRVTLDRLVTQLQEKEVPALSDADWETLRILQGRPRVEAELTEDYNPLEAGLWQFLSLDKGCYIGQETVARLNTYQGVKQYLWGLTFSAPVAIGTPLLHDEKKVGVVTSAVEMAGEAIGLGYVKTAAGVEGTTLIAGEATATLVARPYLTRPPFALAEPQTSV